VPEDIYNSLYISSVSSLAIDTSRVSESRISCRVSRSGKITFNTCFAVYRFHRRRARRSIYILYIYQRAVQLRAAIFWVLRVSRSGKLTFNTSFVVYRIHFRRARSPIYNPYIYQIKSANPGVLFNYISLFFLGHSTNLLLVLNLLLFNHDHSILDIYTSFFATIPYQD
jgi:hypothetical protein